MDDFDLERGRVENFDTRNFKENIKLNLSI